MLGMQRFTLGFSPLLLAGPFAQNPGTTSLTARLDVAPSELLVTPVDHNWSSYNGDYTGRRYSALREIDKSNVSKLRAEWVFHVANSNHLEVTPVVVDGMMFVTSANDAFALDAQTGRTVWHYSRPITE
jgi:alcohol dehydrogenase (cytochrome c)